MKLSAFITVTEPDKRGDTFTQCFNSAKTYCDEVIVIDGNKTWPAEFEWEVIGQHFQKGYEQSSGDFVMHLDTDFIIHEKDIPTLREALHRYDTNPALRFWKYQFFTPDRFNIKSHLVLAVNKKHYGDRLRFDGGGDLCQPTLDGEYIEPLKAPEVKVPVWNYECLLKTKEQIKEDKGRFARAWQRQFNEYKLGGPDDESAYNKWWQMIKGRYSKHNETMASDHHPAVMQETLRNLRPDQFGFNAFGLRP